MNTDMNGTLHLVTSGDLGEIKIILYVIAVVTTLILGSIQVYFNRRHQKNTYVINKLNNTLSAVQESSIGELKNIYRELKTDLYILGAEGYLWDNKKTINNVLDLKISDEDKVDSTQEYKKDIIYRVKGNTYDLLNYYDSLAGSIEDDLIEPGMIFNNYSLMVIDMYRWAKPLIDEQNAKDEFSPWQQFQQMAKAYMSHQDMLKDQLDDHKNNIFVVDVVKVK